MIQENEDGDSEHVADNVTVHPIQSLTGDLVPLSVCKYEGRVKNKKFQ